MFLNTKCLQTKYIAENVTNKQTTPNKTISNPCSKIHNILYINVTEKTDKHKIKQSNQNLKTKTKLKPVILNGNNFHNISTLNIYC